MVDTLETAQHFIFITQLIFCAFYGIAAWDWLTSIPREWRFIWKTKWTPVKISYLFCRYWVLCVGWFLLFCFVSEHSLETCQKIYKLPVALAIWNQFGSQVVLLIRTYAFFNRNIYVFLSLVTALMGVVAYQLYVATSQMLLLPFVNPPYTIGPCFPMSRPHAAHLLGFFLASLAYDTIVTIMTIGKAFIIRRRRGGVVTGSSILIQTFIREGLFYYILISMANLVNGIFYLQPRQSMSAICIPLSVFLSPVLACRLILDLREQGAEVLSRHEGLPAVGHNSSTPPRFVNPTASGITSSGSVTTRSPISSFGLGFMPGNKSNTREKGQLVVSSKHVRGCTTTITMGTGTMEGVELEDFSKEEDDYEEKVDIDGVGGIRVDVEKTSSSI